MRSTDGTRIGTIERVMIDKLTGNAAYAVLSFNSFWNGTRALTDPLGAGHLLHESSRPIASTSPKWNSAARLSRTRTSTGAVAKSRLTGLIGGIAERW